ncbi:hypothetical protein NL676_012803 [Syzygium grande]|nr:hypothetical protein NL676_012803 [Syzygium grande]
MEHRGERRNLHFAPGSVHSHWLSGNPAEGQLRPQLLDRFGMHAREGTVRDEELRIDQDLKGKISKVCAELHVDGLSADIVTNRAAKALSALKGRGKVTAEDIATVIPKLLEASAS